MNGSEELEQTYLAEADQHIAAATARIAGVQAEIAALERDGRDSRAARDVLETLERSLDLMSHYRDVVVRLLRTHGRDTAAPELLVD
jgi:hypothetical protein